MLGNSISIISITTTITSSITTTNICQPPPSSASWFLATVSMLGNATHLPSRGSQPNLKTAPETNKQISFRQEQIDQQ